MRISAVQTSRSQSCQLKQFVIFIGLLQCHHILDQVRTLLLLLEASEDHLRTHHVLLRVDEELEHVLITPSNPGIFVRVAVSSELASACFANKNSGITWSDKHMFQFL